MPKRSQLVEDQINKLAQSNNENPIKNAKSPTVQKLRDFENKVNKLKQIFEDKTIDCKINDNVAQKKSNSPSIIFRSLDCMRRSSSKSPKSNADIRKIDHVVNELIEKEKEYIETLENGIKNYIHPILNPQKCHIPVPREIRLQKFKLFGNIEDIYNLHKSTILPQIIACENDVQKIAEAFIKFVENDTLYCYIDYVIIHLHAVEMVASYQNFFKSLELACKDRLGVQSFVLQPIQKLPRYPLLFEEMIKELSSDMQRNKSRLASLSKAKKKLEKYLIRMNMALKLNDIQETHDLAIPIQYEFITTLQMNFNKDINTPIFFIVPTFTCFSDFRPIINVFDLGRFITIESFECQEYEPYDLYFGEVFLFEKCLLYTKKCGRGDKKNCLSYRNYFEFGPSTSIHLEQEHKRFTMGDIKANRVVTFTAYAIDKIVQFYELIKINHDRRKSRDSAFVDGYVSPKSQSKKYAENNNNIQLALGNEANMSEKVTNHNNADDGVSEWPSDDEFSSDEYSCGAFEVYK